MNKKIIIYGSFIIIILMIINPSIPAVQKQVVKNSFYKKIIEKIENEDYKALKELLIELTEDIEEPSDRVIYLKYLLNKLDKFSNENDTLDSQTKFIFSKLLLKIIGFSLIAIGLFTMYFGSGKSRAQGLIIAIVGFFIIIIT